MGLVGCGIQEDSINLVTIAVDTKRKDRDPCWMTDEADLSDSLVEIIYLF
jgi:hypothetical protein